jgi:CRP-like cAMP-binding protein
MDQKLEALAKVPLLAGLGKDDLAEVGQLSDIVDVPAGHVLMREGAYGSEFYIVLEGTVEVVADGKGVLSTLGPGAFLGEIALVDHGLRTATVTTTTPATLVVLGTREFRSLLHGRPEIQVQVLEAMARRLRQQVATPTD